MDLLCVNRLSSAMVFVSSLIVMILLILVLILVRKLDNMRSDIWSDIWKIQYELFLEKKAVRSRHFRVTNQVHALKNRLDLSSESIRSDIKALSLVVNRDKDR